MMPDDSDLRLLDTVHITAQPPADLQEVVFSKNAYRFHYQPEGTAVWQLGQEFSSAGYYLSKE